MNENEFRRLVDEKGYANVREKAVEPNLDRSMHTHDTSNLVLVMSGEFTLALEDGATTYRAGEWCELAAGTLHTERTGSDGATILLAQK